MAGELLLWALLPMAFVSGWVMSRRQTRAAPPGVNAEYLRGLNHLVNEEPDQAIEVFIKLLDADNETAEVHLALGNLFRRQGEVDRALRIHQNLIARPQLKLQHRNQACYELAQDYLRAGMLDRAENLFSGLVEQGIDRVRALTGLVAIYEQGRDWVQAIEASRKLEAARGQSLRPLIAQYLCEMAEAERRSRNEAKAQELLRQALVEHPDCVRASLMLGAQAEAVGEFTAAVEHYRRVCRQKPEFTSEVLLPLERCHQALHNTPVFRDWLQEQLRIRDDVALQMALARLEVQAGAADAAHIRMTTALHAQPNWRGLQYLLTLPKPGETVAISPELQSVRDTLKKMVDVSARYRCGHCGFDGRSLHWQCPRCRQWDAMQPLVDLTVITPPTAAVSGAAAVRPGSPAMMGG